MNRSTINHYTLDEGRTEVLVYKRPSNAIVTDVTICGEGTRKFYGRATCPANTQFVEEAEYELARTRASIKQEKYLYKKYSNKRLIKEV